MMTMALEMNKDKFVSAGTNKHLRIDRNLALNPQLESFASRRFHPVAFGEIG